MTWILQTDAMETSFFRWKGVGGSARLGDNSVGKVSVTYVNQPEFKLKSIYKEGRHGDTCLSF